MKKRLALLLLCMFLGGCSAKPELSGKWVTSVEDTLCAIVLMIEGDSFTLIQEGRTSTGRWIYDDGSVMLYEDVEPPAQSESVWSMTYEASADTLVLGEWTLHRE